MSQFIGQTHFDFLAQTKKAVVISLLSWLQGQLLVHLRSATRCSAWISPADTPSLLDLQEKPGSSELPPACSAMRCWRMARQANDFQMRELSRPNQLRIQLGMGMEEKGHPFYQMPEVLPEGKFALNTKAIRAYVGGQCPQQSRA